MTVQTTISNNVTKDVCTCQLRIMFGSSGDVLQFGRLTTLTDSVTSEQLSRAGKRLTKTDSDVSEITLDSGKKLTYAEFKEYIQKLGDALDA